MAKIYVKRYTNNGTPKALPAITIADGMQRCVTVDFPSEGYLTRLVIVQTDGTDTTYDVELLDSKIPFPPGEDITGASPADDVELYRIIPQQNITVAGESLELVSKDFGYPFHNTDGTYSDNQRKIYLVLIPAAAGDTTTWDVSLTAHVDVG